MQEEGEMSLRFPLLQGSHDKGRAGKKELGEVMGGVLSCHALAKLGGGFREAV